MASILPRLVVRHGPNPNQEFTLSLKTSIVGREPINDVVFADPEVSRRHARIISQLDNYYIEDLGSTNGTFVNGRRIDKVTRLSHGDIIDLGESVRLTFVLTEDVAISEESMESRSEARLIESTPSMRLHDVSNGHAPAAALIAPHAVVEPAAAPETPTPGAADLRPRLDDTTPANNRLLYLSVGVGAGLLLFACLCGALFLIVNTYAPELLTNLIP